MDDTSRRRVRAIAKRLHWLAQIIIAIFIVLRIFFPGFLMSFGNAIVHASTQRSLQDAEAVFMNTKFFYQWERTDKIAAFVPPEPDTDGLEIWSQSLVEFMRQPCAVFYYDGRSMLWPHLPEEFTGMRGRIDSLVSSGITCTPAAPLVRQVGTLRVQTASFDSTLGAQNLYQHVSAVIAGDPREKIRWGALYRYAESMHAFLDELEYQVDNDILPGEMMILKPLFHFKRHARDEDRDTIRTLQYGLRIYDGATHEVLFETPDLDTTNQSYVQVLKSGSHVHEVFNSDFGEERNQRLLDIVGKPSTIPWVGYLIDLLIMFTLALFYRWILKLTKPESA